MESPEHVGTLVETDDSAIFVAHILRGRAHCGWLIQVIYPMCIYECQNLVFQLVVQAQSSEAILSFLRPSLNLDLRLHTIHRLTGNQIRLYKLVLELG
jgi:hypothetical protein